MSKGGWRFNGNEIKRAISSIQSTGLHVEHVQVSKEGEIRVGVSDPNRPVPAHRADDPAPKGSAPSSQ